MLEHCREGETCCWFSIIRECFFLAASLKRQRILFTVIISVHYTSEFLKLLETNNCKVLTTVFHTSNLQKLCIINTTTYWYFYHTKLHDNVFRPECGHLQFISLNKNKSKFHFNSLVFRFYISVTCDCIKHFVVNIKSRDIKILERST